MTYSFTFRGVNPEFIEEITTAFAKDFPNETLFEATVDTTSRRVYSVVSDEVTNEDLVQFIGQFYARVPEKATIEIWQNPEK